MANKVITVTDPSIVTNDTLSGYNNYSDIDGQLGTTMTPTEATNGKTITLSDGVVHEVTTKPVGTTNGEFTGVVSDAVTVDLSAAEWSDIPSAGAGTSVTDMVDNGNNTWTSTSSLSFGGRAALDAVLTGDFEVRFLFDSTETSGLNTAVAVGTTGDTAWGEMNCLIGRLNSMNLKEDGSDVSPSEGYPTWAFADSGNEYIVIKRVGSQVSVWYDDQGAEVKVHDFTNQISADMYVCYYAGAPSGGTIEKTQYKN